MPNNDYEQLFSSFVTGGGFQQQQYEDFEDGDDFYEGGGRRKKASPKKASPKKFNPRFHDDPKPEDWPPKKRAPRAPKADKMMGDVKVVEVDVFTVIRSSVGETGGSYKSRTPRSAALKAAGALFKAHPSKRTLQFTLQKVTPRSNKRVYAYEAQLEVFSTPQVVVKHDKEGNELRIPIKRSVSIKKIDVDPAIRQQQKDDLKAERKALREKERAKAKKEKKPKAEKKAKAPKMNAEEKKALAALKKAEKEEAKLIAKADRLLTEYSKKTKAAKKAKAPKAPKAPKAKAPKAKAPKATNAKKGRGKKANPFFWGGSCSAMSNTY